jgi:cytochrome c-type biogenesis protein CcmH
VRLAAATAALAVCLALAAPALASEQHPTLAEMEGQVMCPTCHTTLDQSSSAIAQRIKAFISVRIAAGDSRSEIEQKLVAQFGPAVLAAPPHKGFDLLAWWLPFAGLAVAGAAVTIAVWRWSRGREPAAETGAGTQPLEPELERRLDEELARFES